jgi:putative membrane-bound dehydrogenase-like protein
MTRFAARIVQTAALIVAVFPAAFLRAEELPRVPAGFTIEKVTTPELLQHPLMACFDDRGRLFVCESAGTNRPAKELVQAPLDQIRMLEDLDGDGVFDKSTVFADHLVFPQGCLFHDGSIYTCCSPYVWKLTDTDGDGICDERKVLVKSFGFSGNAADIHGPFAGLDGRLYWCDGRHGHEIRANDDGTTGGEDTVANDTAKPEPGLPNLKGELVSKGGAARIFSSKFDGSDVRVHCGGGMDNPVEIDFWETGEVIGTVNLFYSQPRGDCLVHWLPGGVYPREDQQDGIAEFPRTVGLLEPIHNFGHVAVSGMMRYRGQTLGEGFDSSFFITQFNAHKLMRCTLERAGSTFRVASLEEFLVSDNGDFHPTDVLQAPDGSLLLIDTGGWFVIACPQSKIAKPEIAGAIYRIRRTDGASAAVAVKGEVADPVKETLLELGRPLPDASIALAYCGNANLTIRRAAVDAIAALGNEKSTRLNRSDAVDAVIKSLTIEPVDRTLEHAATRAVLVLGDAAQTRRYLRHDLPRVRRAAVVSLDQIPGAELRREEVAPLLDTTDIDLQKAVLDVISRHEGWGAETVSLIAGWLGSNEIGDDRVRVARGFLIAKAGEPEIQSLIAETLVSKASSVAAKSLTLEAMSESDVKAFPDDWKEPWSGTLGSRDEAVRRLALAVARKQNVPGAETRLLRVVENRDEKPELRVLAMEAVIAHGKLSPSEPQFQLLVSQIGDGVELLERAAAARVLASASLSDRQLLTLADRLPQSGVLATTLLKAFETCSSNEVGQRLVDVLKSGATPIPAGRIERAFRQFPEAIRSQAAVILAARGVDPAAQKQKLAELERATESGDATRGRDTFLSAKAMCSRCHRVRGEGGLIGPDLSTVGAIRQRKDLLESIAFPSASFVRGFQPYLVADTDGRTHEGVLTRETTGDVTLMTSQLAEVRIKRSEIESMRESDVSIMPTGLETRLSSSELADLVAYLTSLK